MVLGSQSPRPPPRSAWSAAKDASTEVLALPWAQKLWAQSGDLPWINCPKNLQIQPSPF